jgi:hypothetical protein
VFLIFSYWLSNFTCVSEATSSLISFQIRFNTNTELFLYLCRQSFQDWVVSVPDGPVEVLTIIERYNAKLCEAPKKFNLKGETYHWIQSYHLNFRLYEKLLCIVFDILEDGQLVEEADEILETVKLTWTILGITQKLHDTLFAWVLFKKVCLLLYIILFFFNWGVLSVLRFYLLEFRMSTL